jgi:hypothetical protein
MVDCESCGYFDDGYCVFSVRLPFASGVPRNSLSNSVSARALEPRGRTGNGNGDPRALAGPVPSASPEHNKLGCLTLFRFSSVRHTANSASIPS